MTYEETRNNLIPLTERDPETARAIRSKGGKAAQAAAKERRSFEADIKRALATGDAQGSIIAAMITAAAGGSVSAATWLRDTIGEAPTQKTADVSEAVKREETDRAEIMRMLENVG